MHLYAQTSCQKAINVMGYRQAGPLSGAQVRLNSGWLRIGHQGAGVHIERG